MGLLELLTMLFIAFKLTGIITWSWFIVLSPLLGAIVLYAIAFFCGLFLN